MSDTVEKNMEAAQASLANVEKVTAVIFTEPKGELITLEAADKPTSAAITKRMAELDMEDTNSIIGFGSSAQAELQVISQSMLQGVRNKDVGSAGDS
jgi:uncharacterized protein YaaN involved in tellurite resistance